MNITGFGQKKSGQAQYVTNIEIGSLKNPQFHVQVEAYVFPKLTGSLPSTVTQNLRFTQGLDLADPLYNQPGNIDLLLGGADVYSSIILNGLKRGTGKSPVAQNTQLGWIISGTVVNAKMEKICMISCARIDENLRKFWEIEDMNHIRKLTVDEEQAERHFFRDAQEVARWTI